jgi:2-keto-4-pentenoate hydratase/2-oxohepta-3-ene-1,7-dioic acid hydratase in catechol pathway
MKLVRFGPAGSERPGVLDANGQIRDLTSVVPDIAGSALLPESIQSLTALDVDRLPLVTGSPRLGPCVANTGKYICIGLNYIDHAAETIMPVPPEPIIFMKATSAIVGPMDDIELPRGGEKVDWEVELGVVIGAAAKYVTEEQALQHVAGYCVVNDVSERSFQLEHQGQWTKGKSHDTFGPIGPCLVTADEVPDPQKLDLWLKVNDRVCQNGSTASMIYNVRYLVSYLSRFMTLHPGDIIATGTPPGVGMGQKPQVFLRSGDVVTLGIAGLGAQKQHVISARNH